MLAKCNLTRFSLTDTDKCTDTQSCMKVPLDSAHTGQITDLETHPVQSYTHSRQLHQLPSTRPKMHAWPLLL